jgi:hypothetical protein
MSLEPEKVWLEVNHQPLITHRVRSLFLFLFETGKLGAKTFCLELKNNVKRKRRTPVSSFSSHTPVFSKLQQSNKYNFAIVYSIIVRCTENNF